MAEGGDIVSMSKLKPSLNQVAGHTFEEGHVGSLVDDSGYFYKPLQDGERGEREVKFYERFWADETVPSDIKHYFPRYKGCVYVTPPNQTAPVKFAVLEDITRSFNSPSIIDIKMGFRTWYPEAGEQYIKKCKKKDEVSTSGALGLRVSGMQVYDRSTASVWKADRNWCRNLNVTGVSHALRRFVSSNPFDEENPNGEFAAEVYGPASLELERLLSWFEKQTTYHFYSSSVLIVYSGEAEQMKQQVRLVDFAHVTYDHEEADENYAKALKSLLSVLNSAANFASN